MIKELDVTEFTVFLKKQCLNASILKLSGHINGRPLIRFKLGHNETS